MFGHMDSERAHVCPSLQVVRFRDSQFGLSEKVEHWETSATQIRGEEHKTGRSWGQTGSVGQSWELFLQLPSRHKNGAAVGHVTPVESVHSEVLDTHFFEKKQKKLLGPQLTDDGQYSGPIEQVPEEAQK